MNIKKRDDSFNKYNELLNIKFQVRIFIFMKYKINLQQKIFC